MSDIETGKWCWSINEENYEGCHDTEEKAHGEAMDALEGERDPGERASYWIAKTVSPLDNVGSAILGERIAEQVEEWMLDDCFGCDFDEILSMTDEDKEALGELALSFIREKGVIQYYTVTDVKEHTYVVPESA